MRELIIGLGPERNLVRNCLILELIVLYIQFCIHNGHTLVQWRWEVFFL